MPVCPSRLPVRAPRGRGELGLTTGGTAAWPTANRPYSVAPARRRLRTNDPENSAVLTAWSSRERTFAALREDEAGLWDDLQALLDGLTEAQLDREVQEPRRGGSFRTVTLRDGLWHLVEEELQHRGELNALLWQMDVDSPILQFMDVA